MGWVGACSICSVGCFPRASLGSFSGQQLPCILGMRLRMSSWLCLAQRSVGWGFGVLSSISPPSSPYSGEEGPLLNSFSIELTVQCDGCLFWGLGWRGGARGWVAGWAGLWGVPPTWVWVVGFSPQILEHPTSICDTGVKCILASTKKVQCTCMTVNCHRLNLHVHSPQQLAQY